MVPDPDDDMLAEYDFSASEPRGQGASSIRDGGAAAEWVVEAVHYDRQAWVSEALRLVQQLEASLVVHLALVGGHAPGEAARAVVAPGDRLLGLLDAARMVRPDLRRRLESALAEREWLVHRSLPAGASCDVETSRTLVRRLQTLAKDVAELDGDVRAATAARLREAGLSEREIEDRRRAALGDWLAA